MKLSCLASIALLAFAAANIASAQDTSRPGDAPAPDGAGLSLDQEHTAAQPPAAQVPAQPRDEAQAEVTAAVGAETSTAAERAPHRKLERPRFDRHRGVFWLPF